jgi:glycosyltransferase involved in cell wall biosynthesis
MLASESDPPPGGAVDVSIVVPLYNEADNIPTLYRETSDAMEQLGRSHELILVDDGSQDRTPELLAGLAHSDPRVLVVTFRRNFGQTAAMAAGIDLAQGAVIVPMDGDLQNDPADIATLLRELDRGYDVVSGWRKDRKDPLSRIIPSRLANVVISWVGGVRLHDYGCTLKAYRRETLDEVRLYGEMHRFIPIFARWQGARVTEIPVRHRPRKAGRSHYGMERVLKVVLDLIVLKFFSAYITKPIYVFGGFGMASIGLSLLTFMLSVTFKLIPPDNPWDPHWHKDFIATPLPVLSVGLFVVGLQMIFIGLLAEVLMRTYFESQNKRAYVIKSLRGRGRSPEAAAEPPA